MLKDVPRFECLLNAAERYPTLSSSAAAELAEEAGVTRGTMTGLVDTLVKDGPVMRTNDARDRRAVRVQITAAGSKLLARVLPGYFAAVTKMIQLLNKTERAALVT